MIADRSRRRTVSARVRRRRALAVLLAVSLTAGVWLWGPDVWSALPSPWQKDDPAVVSADLRTTPTTVASVDSNAAAPAADGESDDNAQATAVAATTPPTTGPSTPVRALPKGLTSADVAAGVLSKQVPQGGNGRLSTVKGDVAAPGKGTVYTVRVQVEGGLAIDREKFAAFVLRTLNDDRSWGHGGKKRFARTDGRADITVVLASPDLSEAMCRPLVTNGTLSCRQGERAILTLYRWVKAIPGYGRDRTGYRQYVVNHEVGHALGHGHEYCPGMGSSAPVMMQQTKGLGVCTPNPWPFP